MRAALIVDDDTAILRNLGRLLRENGYEVAAVMTGEEAILEIKKRHFDLLLLDYVLPDMTGLTLLEAISDKVRDAVKIMITGFPTLSEMARAFDLGVDSYVEKPINPPDLLGLIEQKMSLKGKATGNSK